MFDFFKRKKANILPSETAITTCEEEKDNSSHSIATGVAIDSAVRDSTLQAKINYTRPEYNPQSRKAYYDDPKAHEAAIESAFSSGKTVRDSYSGAELVKKQRDAKLRFGEDWQSHAAEADHIDPLSQIAKRTSKNPFLTTEDVKEVGNSPDNFQVISRKLNQTSKEVGKGGSTQQEWADDPIRMQGVAESIESGESIDVVVERIKKQGKAAEKRNDKRVRIKSIKNAASTAHEAGKYGAKNAGITTATMSGIMNITAVIKGEKSVEDAVGDTIIDTGKAAASGYLMSGGLTTLYQSLSGSSSKFIKALSKSNVPGKVITSVIVVGDTLKKWGNGEITTQQCLIELGDKGLNMATAGYSMAIGQALIPIPIVGGAIGALVGSMLTSNYYNSLVKTLQTRELEHQERIQIIAECKAAAEQAKAFREELEAYLDSYFKEYRDCFDDAISSMKLAYQVGDADGMITSANEITRKLGGQVHYETVAEFKTFLDDDTVDIF